MAQPQGVPELVGQDPDQRLPVGEAEDRDGAVGDGHAAVAPRGHLLVVVARDGGSRTRLRGEVLEPSFELADPEPEFFLISPEATLPPLDLPSQGLELLTFGLELSSGALELSDLGTGGALAPAQALCPLIVP